ncbi:MAG: tRNA glutamyl-Q(34) synthetase GluQRS [Colwellia sp.]
MQIERPPLIATTEQYRGRFAPSPSGLLHFGSLIAALASFLDAKSSINSLGQQGKWLVRIEDIDPPREKQGASKHILKTLEAFGLHWDEEVRYQSLQSERYLDLLAQLQQQNLIYACQCTRAIIKASGGLYTGTCRNLHLSPENNALRLVNQYGMYQFDDIFQGIVSCNKQLAEEDFIIHRKDGLFAYQLAVVADDMDQKINHVIRGSDLLEPTARQLTLFKTFSSPSPKYGHIPLAVTAEGFKLSKQNSAPPINNAAPQPTLLAALKFLGQPIESEMVNASVEQIIKWSIKHWQRGKVPQQSEILIT